MTFLTDFADQAVMLPIIAAVALLLAVRGQRHAALVWLTAIGATFAVVLLLKLCFMACGPVFAGAALRTPSGHTAAASVVAGGLMALFTARRWMVLAAALLAAVVIGWTRLSLGVHSVPEVLVGGLLGVAGAGVMSRALRQPAVKRPAPVLGVVVVLAILLHGVRLPAEAAIARVSVAAFDFVPACRP
jgi:membrane-associated phospholipid phosphatase